MGAVMAAPVTGRGGAGPLRGGALAPEGRRRALGVKPLGRSQEAPQGRLAPGGRTAIRPAAAGAVEAEVPRRRNGGVGGGWALSWLLQ